MALPDFQHVETVDLVVPLSVDEVRERLRSTTNLTWMGGGTFQGWVGKDRFRLRLRKVQRRNLRPTLIGALEALPDGRTRIRGECALPWWAKHLGRASVIGALVGGLGVAGTAIGVGHAELGAYYWLLLAAAAWMPVVAVLLPGWLVVDAVEERAQVPEALAGLFAAAPPPLEREPLKDADRAPRARQRDRESP